MRALTVVLIAALAGPAGAQTIGSLTSFETDVPVRLTGIGLVVGLDGTGDRNISSSAGRSGLDARLLSNMLERFGASISPEAIRARNVAAVAVMAEVSAFVRPGGRADVWVSSMLDASSLRGGQLLMTSLFSDAGEEFFVGTAQGPVTIPTNSVSRLTGGRGASGMIEDGAVIEAEMPRPTMDSTTRLILHNPDVSIASRIVTVINTAYGGDVAAVVDPGIVGLNTAQSGADNVFELLAGIDSLPVNTPSIPTIVVSRADGSVGTVGTITLRPATVVHAGITVTIGGTPSATPVEGLVEQPAGADLSSLVAGLHAVGTRPDETAGILQLLRAAGALDADIVVR